MKNLLEIACFNIESCLIAQKAGADRIEFCKNYDLEGLSPDKNEILAVREQVKIPLHIIIRPHANNFFYSKQELEIMKNEILFCKENNIDGVVFGILTKENEIEKEAVSLLKDAAGTMHCTFHRAIDVCKDLHTSIQSLIDLDIDSVLTSGSKGTALEGKKTLADLTEHFSGKINIIAGGNIRSDQFPELFESKCTNYHSSAIIDNSQLCSESEIKKMAELLKKRNF